MRFLRFVFIDTHAHLYHAQFDADRRDVVQRALQAGLSRLYLPNVDHESVAAMDAMAGEWPDLCRPMMGLHPCSVGDDPSKDLAEVERSLATGRYWAVGEIGIDLYWDKSRLPQQQVAFRTQVRWAAELGLPIAIHCRESFEEVISIVEEENGGQLRGVFHCFTGPAAHAARIAALGGFFLGIGGVITYPKSGLFETMREVGPERCVLETDAPYLAPVPYRGKRNESSYLPFVATKLAEATQRSLQEIARITTANAVRLFGE